MSVSVDPWMGMPTTDRVGPHGIMFTSLWVCALLWGWLKAKIKPLAWWGLVLLLLPSAIDGTTHFISNLAGIGQGFRDSNIWLAALTQHSFPADFYAGDAWGSFIAWLRDITGLLRPK